MQKKYKNILSFIAILLLVCIVIGVLYLFYEKVTDDDYDVSVVGELSINYLQGSHVTQNNTYTFSITNNGSNDIYYEILINNLKNYEKQVKYTLKSSEASLNISENNLDTSTNILATSLLIPKNTTQNFTLNLTHNKMTSFDLVIKKIIDSKEYFYATILNNNKPVKNPTTIVGKDLGTTSEGLIESYDDYGLTYYFRGAITNNYVNFADNLWRIVRINGDGTVKIVLNGVSSELSSYHSELSSSEDLPNTSLYESLNAYYSTYLQNYDDFIASTKYCSDNLNTTSDSNKTYNAFARLVTNNIPSFNCLSTPFTSKIGLLTADEVMYAGANFLNDNKDYYLYNSQIENVWWTSTLASATSTEFYPFVVDQNGKLLYNVSGTLFRSVRPSITLNREVMMSGDGTIDNPYTLTTAE